MERVRLRITGHVQGVFYRDSTRRRALELGITGWVRNEPDGSVLAEVQADAARVAEMVQWCHDGPQRAEVTGVDVHEIDPQDDETTFLIR